MISYDSLNFIDELEVRKRDIKVKYIILNISFILMLSRNLKRACQQNSGIEL